MVLQIQCTSKVTTCTQDRLVFSRPFQRREPTRPRAGSRKSTRRFRWYSLLISTVGVLIICMQQRYIFLWKRHLEQDGVLSMTDQVTTATKTPSEISGFISKSKSGGGSSTDANYSNSNRNRNNLFPPVCSADQLETIRHQLPARLCTRQANQPWEHGGQCSFSFATRCPYSVWLEEFFRQKQQQQQRQKQQQQQQQHQERASESTTFTAIYVGCNKGMDAINTLRMGSANTTYNKDIWRDTLFAGHPSSEIVPGHCGQEFGPQFEIHPSADDNNENMDYNNNNNNNNLSVISNAVVHCIEPLPRNSNRLAATAKQLQIQDNFQVHAVAMSNRNGIAFFPADTKMGDEQQGIGSCDYKSGRNNNNKACQAVPMYKLDTFLSNVLQNDMRTSQTMIDFLSIDVEGYDSLVLQGGVQTLLRTKYLEFEYNWKGPWAHVSLLTTIESLKSMGFACYWAGSHRNIWRITDCWLDHYDTKFWSNVACVNVQLAVEDEEPSKELAHLMEQMFQETLQQGHAIQYKDFTTANTDGRVSVG